MFKLTFNYAFCHFPCFPLECWVLGVACRRKGYVSSIAELLPCICFSLFSASKSYSLKQSTRKLLHLLLNLHKAYCVLLTLSQNFRLESKCKLAYFHFIMMRHNVQFDFCYLCVLSIGYFVLAPYYWHLYLYL